MKQPEKKLPLSTAALVMGALSVPLAFAWHLCSLAVVLGVYATVAGLWGRRRATKHLLIYSATSQSYALWGMRLGLLGLVLASIMWLLWATNWLLT